MKTIGKIIHNKTFNLKILDSKKRKSYFENEYGLWSKRQYDKDGNLIYFENSSGNMHDNRP